MLPTSNRRRRRDSVQNLGSMQFRFFPVELRKKHWRDYIRYDNPMAAALLSKMGYTESKKVELKKEFLRMLV